MSCQIWTNAAKSGLELCPYDVKFIGYHCMMVHTFNSHVKTGTNPCINKANHILLMHGFGTLNTLILGQSLTKADPFSILIWLGHGKKY